jgi:hypothetical protein
VVIGPITATTRRASIEAARLFVESLLVLLMANTISYSAISSTETNNNANTNCNSVERWVEHKLDVTENIQTKVTRNT